MIDAAPPPVLLSVVTPVFNGEAYVERNVRSIVDALEALGEPFEVIAVCDGCTDRSAECARRVDDERVRVIDYPANQGKGHAIAHGMELARGRLVGWLDSDLDIDPEVMVRAVREFAQEPVDAVIGSKRHPDSAVDYPLIRRVYSAVFQLVVATLFRFNARDTQVGAKVLRRECVEVVQPLLLVKRYAFDLEVLAVSAEFGFDRVREIPIRLDYQFSGTGIDWRAVRRMVQDTLAIAYRIHLRHWYVRRFASLQRQRMDDAAAARTPAARVEREGVLAP